MTAPAERVTAGLTTPSSSRLLADQLAAAVQDELSGRGIASRVELIEVRDHAHDLTNNLLTGFPNSSLLTIGRLRQDIALPHIASGEAVATMSNDFMERASAFCRRRK